MPQCSAVEGKEIRQYHVINTNQKHSFAFKYTGIVTFTLR